MKTPSEMRILQVVSPDDHKERTTNKVLEKSTAISAFGWCVGFRENE